MIIENMKHIIQDEYIPIVSIFSSSSTDTSNFMPTIRRKVVLVIRLISWMILVLVVRAFPPHILYLRTNYNEHNNEFDADIENYVQSIDCGLQDYVNIISFFSLVLGYSIMIGMMG